MGLGREEHAADAYARIKAGHAGTRLSYRRDVPLKHQHGNPEELQARLGGSFRALPDSSPSNFRPIGPATLGGNINDLQIRSRRNDGTTNQKFSQRGNPL